MAITNAIIKAVEDIVRDAPVGQLMDAINGLRHTLWSEDVLLVAFSKYHHYDGKPVYIVGKTGINKREYDESRTICWTNCGDAPGVLFAVIEGEAGFVSGTSDHKAVGGRPVSRHTDDYVIEGGVWYDEKIKDFVCTVHHERVSSRPELSVSLFSIADLQTTYQVCMEAYINNKRQYLAALEQEWGLA